MAEGREREEWKETIASPWDSCLPGPNDRLGDCMLVGWRDYTFVVTTFMILCCQFISCTSGTIMIIEVQLNQSWETNANREHLSWRRNHVLLPVGRPIKTGSTLPLIKGKYTVWKYSVVSGAWNPLPPPPHTHTHTHSHSPKADLLCGRKFRHRVALFS